MTISTDNTSPSPQLGRSEDAASPNSGGTTRKTRRRQINWPLLVGTLVVGSVLVVAGYFWRNYQIQNLSDSLLERVAQLEAERNWSTAVGYLQRYITLNPEAQEVHIRAAKAFDHDLRTANQYDNAISLYYRAIGIDPKDSTLRRRLAELLFERGSLASADEEARKLLAEPETQNDAIAQRIVALVAYRNAVIRDDSASVQQALSALKAANVAHPADIEVAYSLAILYRSKSDKTGIAAAESAKLADEVISKMVESDPAQAEAWLARARYRKSLNQPGINEDFEQALKLAPNNASVLIFAGEHALTSSPPNMARAADLFRRTLVEAPWSDRAHIGLAATQKARGETAIAIDTLNKGRKLVPSPESIDRELFELHLAARDVTKAKEVLDQLKKDAEVQGLRETALERLTKRLFLARLEAQWLLANNQPSLVPPLITKTLATSGALGDSMVRNPELARCRLLLAQAYGALENWELAAAEFSHVASASTVPTELTLAACEAWKRAGQYDQAIESYERALRSADVSPVFWIGLAQAQFEKQIRSTSTSSRDWQPFLALLAKAKVALPKSSDLRFLEVDFLLAQNDPAKREQAEALLRDGEKVLESDKEYWRRLVIVYERLKLPTDADRALKHFGSLNPDKASVSLVQVNLLAMRKQFPAAEKLLAETIAAAPEAFRRPLLAYQMQLAVEAGDLATARKRLASLRTDDPTNLMLLRRAAELAFDARDWSELGQLEEPLRKAEGESGHAWRLYRAARLLATARRDSLSEIAEAEKLVAAIVKERPRWAPATVLSGQLAEARGDANRAIASYTSAIDAGDRRIATYERLLGLLYRQNRFADAQQIFDDMGKGASSSDRLETLAMLTAAQQDQRGRALELARQALAERPNDAMRHVWLAEMQQLNDQRSEAIATLQKAVSIAPQDVRPWNSVFMYHVRGKDLVKAEKTLLELAKQVKLEPAQKSFILGQGYELLGKRPEALNAYREAVKQAPKDVAMLSRLAGLLLHDDVAAAEATLRQIIAVAPDNVRARQALATMLALRDGDGAWDEAQQLLKQATPDGSTLPADERLRAVLLVRRGGDKQRRIAQHAEASQILKARVDAETSPAAADRLLLAGVYESEAQLLVDASKLQAAREQLGKLAESANATEGHLSTFAEFLIRHVGKPGASVKVPLSTEAGDAFLAEAASCIDRLDAMQRKAGRYPNSQILGLRARWLTAKGRGNEIETLVESLAEQHLASLKKEPEQNQWMLEVGNVYMSVEQLAPAERWFRRLWTRVPQAYQPLVQSLAAQGNYAEVVSVCGAAAKSDNSPRPAQVLASSLASGKPTKDDLAKAEPLISQALQSHPTDANLLFAVAVLRTVGEQTQEAIELFERVVKAAPQNLLALNNLATLLAEQPQRQNDALRYIEQAIQVAGRKPALLDTQGTIYLMQGDFDAAVRCLEEAVNSEATDPRYPFHLAAAYAKLGRKEDALAAYERAKQDDLDDHVLTAGDALLRKLLDEL